MPVTDGRVDNSSCYQPRDPTPGKPTPNRRLVFGIVALGLFMASVDATIVATALHPIGRSLHSTLNWTGWAVTIYQLGQIVAMPLAGRFSEHIGRRRVYLLSAVIFTTASLLCGLSDSIYMLLGLRFVQSLGGGGFMPSASGIVADHFGRDRDRALALFTSIFPIGGIIGPTFGGIIAQDWTWRGIFLINVPLGLVLILLTIRFIPRGPAGQAAPVDLRGIALLAVALLLGMLGIAALGSQGVEPWDPRALIPFVLSVVLGFGFVRHAQRAPDPFIPAMLLLDRRFLTVNLINAGYGSVLIGFAALVPIYAVNRYGLSLSTAGTLLAARAVGTVSLAGISAMTLRRVGCRLPMLVGFGMVAISMIVLALPPPGSVSAYVWLAGWSLLTGLGMGISTPATNNTTMQLAPSRVTQIAGLRGMFRQSGGILSVSITTALLARTSHPGAEQSYAFLVSAGVMAALIVLACVTPDHKGRW